ncbi:hypothetical protein FZI91_08450 [Mycobacterium sp. CBMA271]|nr:hypothetical protein [Mycobacteroides sp. CBMA 326]MUM19319.1 hypothetical protein [Mycobacteroides sp. CBMA 326]MUM21732.1 hypothetical protein [Mycobacteroides sp. CBMA 271]
MALLLVGLLVSLALVHCPRAIQVLTPTLSSQPGLSTSRDSGTFTEAAPAATRHGSCTAADSSVAHHLAVFSWSTWGELVLTAVPAVSQRVSVWSTERAPPRRIDTVISGRALLHILCVSRR